MNVGRVQGLRRLAPAAGPSAVGLALLVLLLSPPLRRGLESSMTLHMLVQYPALMGMGACLVAAAVPQSVLRSLQRANELGLAGLLFAALTLAVLMVPRVLDLARVDLRVEVIKMLALALAGAAIRLSWPRAGTVIQAFFLGNVLPMLAVAGTLYQESTIRLCQAYLLHDQQTLGMALVALAFGLAALWLGDQAWRQGFGRAVPAARAHARSDSVPDDVGSGSAPG